MTTAELIAALAQECPNGVSFNPMAVRLLRRKVPFEDWQITKLQADMFQLENGLWFSTEMISNKEVRLALREQATTLLIEHGYFSVDRLFNDFSGILTHLTTREDFAVFLRHLGFPVENFGKGDLFCLQSSASLNECLMTTSKTILNKLEEADGTLPFDQITDLMPHLTSEALASIRAQFLPQVHTTEIGGVPCWCSADAIPLPEDFSDIVTTAIDTLFVLDEKVTAAKLEFALNLFYRTHFREEYSLLDKDTFMHVCVKYYRGKNEIYLNKGILRLEARDSHAAGKRPRSQNTRFGKLGIPVGAELVYIKAPNITCIVLDDVNQVEYAGKAWAISALAMHLLGVSSANGFRHFSYEGELLWDKRSKLEQTDKKDESGKIRKARRAIIGLEGRALSSATWRAFRSAGTNPRVAEWERRIARGESIENIASENGLMVSTVKEYIVNRRRYLEVCYKNGIVPERLTNV